MAVFFYNEDINLPEINQKQLKLWLKQVASNFEMKIGKISYIFTSDKNILKVNQAYLQHDYYTDVITFDYSSDKEISGDIFISLDTVASNAKLFEVAYQEELHRVIIHGVLHLLGLKDKTDAEAAEMRAEENKALKILKNTL